MASKNKKLRSGYTTGACAAAAAKAATMLLLSVEERKRGRAEGKEVEIPFPDGSRVKFKIQDSRIKIQDEHLTATASVIKDAGDDPDVTNGAEIVATVKVSSEKLEVLTIKGGKGVGVITKPGLSIPVGEPAINPVPRKMIREAVLEAVQGFSPQASRRGDKGSFILRSSSFAALRRMDATENGRVQGLEITISVVNGEEIAKKTLNSRLGITGGISILGTTGIVKPVSSEAWTATIASSMDVAKAMGYDKIVLSAGRTSEKAHIKKINFPEESYVMMGDYLEFSLLEAKKHGFKKIYLCAQWAKMLKIAMATPQTHVRHGAIDLKKAAGFLKGLGIGDWGLAQEFNTAMEIFNFINSELITHNSKLFKKVCLAAKKYAEGIAEGIPVAVHLVSYGGEVIAGSE
ncbi:MAG: cobalt-precorrin-5B (C(1))-methyltransferase CbiD [Thermodesulfovibrionales bacterium]|nr:cobalt-precorrin-5B (C(1))-methyltransferase CbiD [Thermodesulfovibrionales bacterium]